MQEKMWGNQYRTTIVCVDTYDRNGITGQLYNPFLSGGKPFQGIMDFIWSMEGLLDEMQFPQPFTQDRCFGERATPSPEPTAAVERQRGRIGTFAVRVLFRQNSSWQGTVTWMEGHREENFRSALELLKTMDSAMYSAVCSEEQVDGCSCGA